MNLKPRKVCKRLSVKNNIGVCTLKDCVCTCWLCEFKENCGKEVFTNCQLKSTKFHEMTDVSSIFKEALKKIDDELQLLLENGTTISIMGGLLHRRENEILHCFYEAPGDLPSAINTGNLVLDDDISEIKIEDVKFDSGANKIWDLIVLKEVYSNKVTRIENGDIRYFANKKGRNELLTLIINPKNDLELMRESLEQNYFPTIKTQNVREVYSTKMLMPMEWCLANINQTNLMDFTLHKNFNQIIEHIYNVGKTGKIDLNVCYELAYPHYSGMLHVCRYSYSKFNHIKEISQKNKDLHLLLEEKYGITFDIEIGFDNFLWKLNRCNDVGKYCLDEVIGEDSKNYRFILQDGSLFGSVILLGFISKNFDQICLKPYERGRVFEDFVAKQLNDRDVKIIHRNYESPEGEIDFICKKKKRIFFIEAKDYGPWFDDSYISSRTYAERINKINRKLQNALPRYHWVDSNREHLRLNPHDKIEGIILTRFHEPHLEKLHNFVIISQDDLDQKFGKSKFETYENKIYDFSPAQMSMMKTQLMTQKIDENDELELY